MKEKLIEKERTNSVNIETEIPLEDKINIETIKQARATEILYQSVNVDEYFIEKLPEDTKNYDKSIKIILLGNSNVGKSSIVHCLGDDPYNNYQRSTVGLDHYNYIIRINNIVIRMQIWDTAGQEKFDSITLNYFKNADVAIFVYAINDKNSFNKIEQWDNQLNDKINIIDNDRNNTLNDEQDIEDKKDIDDKKDKDDKKDTDKDKNENINVKQEEINKNLIKVLLGNKKDLENERQVTYEEGEQLSKSKNFDLFKEISSSLEIGENGECYVDDIINLFNIIGKKIYKDFIKKDYGRLNSSSYCYQASSSILKGNKYEKNKKKDKSCCC